MNKLIKLFFTLFSFVFFSNAIASTLNIDAIKDNLSSHVISKADFSQKKILKQAGKTLLSSGKMTLVKNTGVLWSQQEPFALDIVITNNSFKQILDDEITLLTKEENPQMFNVTNIILKIFSVDEDISKHFELKTKGDLNHWYLEFTPKDEMLKKIFKIIKLTGSKNLNQLVIENTNEDSTAIDFSNYDFSSQSLTDKENSYFE